MSWDEWNETHRGKDARSLAQKALKKVKAKMVMVSGHTVREGTKRHNVLVEQARIWDDLRKYETN